MDNLVGNKMKITRNQIRRIIREETVGVEDPNKTAEAFADGEVAEEIFVDTDKEGAINVNEKRPGAAGQVADIEIIPERRKLTKARIKRIIMSELQTKRSEEDLEAGSSRDDLEETEEIDELQSKRAEEDLEAGSQRDDLDESDDAEVDDAEAAAGEPMQESRKRSSDKTLGRWQTLAGIQ